MKRREVNNSECVTSIEGLSDEQVEQFREAFLFMDKDNNGFISCKELGTILRVLGQNPTEAELQDMINSVDRDQNGVLDFPEFAALMVHYHGEKQEEDELWMAFSVFDRDGTGFISATELKYALTNLGNALSEDEVDYMFEHGEALVDVEDRLDYADFLRHFLRTRRNPPADDAADNTANTANTAASSTKVGATAAATSNTVTKSSRPSLNQKGSCLLKTNGASGGRSPTPKRSEAGPPSSPRPSTQKSTTDTPTAQEQHSGSGKKRFSRFSFKRKSSSKSSGHSTS